MVKKRCIFCRKVVRADGTCQNQNCVMYVPDDSKDDEAPTQHTNAESNYELLKE